MINGYVERVFKIYSSTVSMDSHIHVCVGFDELYKLPVTYSKKLKIGYLIVLVIRGLSSFKLMH